MKTQLRSIFTYFIIVFAAMVLMTAKTSVFGQSQNQRLQEILQESERETITITAQIFGDIQFDSFETPPNIFFILQDDTVIRLGDESGKLTAEEVASVYIYRPNRKKDLIIEIKPVDDEDTADEKSEVEPEKRILYIVDGIELLEEHVHNIPPNNIKSISILKGDSAAEKYGKNPEEIKRIIVIETKSANFGD